MRIWLARGLVLATGIYFLWRVFLPGLTAMTHSFPAYYTAARLVLAGQWSAQAYDDAWFGARVLALTGGRISERISMNPPPTALLFLPIAWLDLTIARGVWQGLNLALLLLTLWLLRAIVRAEHSSWFWLFAALVFFFPPLLENFRVGQVYVLLLFLFCLVLWQAQRARAVGAGLALGAALAVKLSGAPLLLMWVRRREWRALWVACATAAAIACVSVLVLGSEGWLAFFQRALD